MKKRIRWICAAVTLAVCGTASLAFGQNLLTNGGFDGGTTFGWSSAAGNVANPTYGDGGFNAGSWAAVGASAPLGVIAPFAGADSGVNFADGGLAQFVLVTAGQAYDFSGETALSLTSHQKPPHDVVSPIGWGSYVQLDWLNAAGQHLDAAGGVIAAPAISGLGYAHIFDLDVKNLPRNQWNAFDTTFTAPTGAVQAVIKIGTWATDPTITPANPTQFDSMSFVTVPEPATDVFLILGFVAMAPIVRRQMRKVLNRSGE